MEISKAVTGCKLCQALGAGEIDTCQGDQVKDHSKLHNYQLRLIAKSLSKGQCRKELRTAPTIVTESSQDQGHSAEVVQQEPIEEDEQVLISKTNPIAKTDLVVAHCRSLLTNKVKNGFVQCAQCHKRVKVTSGKSSYIYAPNAIQHVYTHLEKRLFDCSLCKYSSSTKSGIRHHVKTHGSQDDKHFIDLTPDHQNEIIEAVTACFGHDQMGNVLQVQKAVPEDKILFCPSDQAIENGEDALMNSVAIDNAIDEQVLSVTPDQIDVEQVLAIVNVMDEQVLPIAPDSSIMEQPTGENAVARATEDQSQSIEDQSISVIAKDIIKEESKSDQNPIAKIDSIDDRVKALLKNRLKNDRVPCSECGFTLKVAFENEIDVSAVIDHMGYHLVKMLFGCPLCDHKTCTKEAMQNHLTKHDLGASAWDVIDLTDHYKEEICGMLESCFGQSASKSKFGKFQKNSGAGLQKASHAFGDEIRKPSEQSKAQGQSSNPSNFGNRPRQFWYKETVSRDFGRTASGLSSDSGPTIFPTGRPRPNTDFSRPASASGQVGPTVSSTSLGNVFNNDNWRKDPSSASNRITVDGQLYDMRFIGDAAIVERNGYPHRIHFVGPPIFREVLVDGQAHKLAFRETRTVVIDGQRVAIRFGTPFRELYLGSFPFSAEFGGLPIRATFNGVDHQIQLCGPQPRVKIDQEPAYDLFPYLRDSRDCVAQRKGLIPLIDRNLAKSLLSEICRDQD